MIAASFSLERDTIHPDGIILDFETLIASVSLLPVHLLYQFVGFWRERRSGVPMLYCTRRRV